MVSDHFPWDYISRIPSSWTTDRTPYNDVSLRQRKSCVLLDILRKLKKLTLDLCRLCLTFVFVLPLQALSYLIKCANCASDRLGQWIRVD